MGSAKIQVSFRRYFTSNRTEALTVSGVASRPARAALAYAAVPGIGLEFRVDQANICL